MPTAGDKPQRYNPLSPPLWIPAFAGMTNGGAGMTRTRNGGVQRLGTLGAFSYE